MLNGAEHVEERRDWSLSFLRSLNLFLFFFFLFVGKSDVKDFLDHTEWL